MHRALAAAAAAAMLRCLAVRHLAVVVVLCVYRWAMVLPVPAARLRLVRVCRLRLKAAAWLCGAVLRLRAWVALCLCLAALARRRRAALCRCLAVLARAAATCRLHRPQLARRARAAR